MKQYNQNPIFFKDSLFESVSFQPWSLEYKMMFTETRLMLADILTEFQAWHAATNKLFEADTESTTEVLARFQKLEHLSVDNYEKLKAHVSKPKDAPPPGLLNKALNMLKKQLDKLNRMTTYPPVDDFIQSTIGRILTKSEDSPWKESIKKFLRVLLTIAKKGGWVGSLVLLVLGITQAILGLPFLGSTLGALTIVVAIWRVVADLVNGKSLVYAVGKAATLAGAGYAAKELFNLVMPLLSTAEAATPPATLGGGATDAARAAAAQEFTDTTRTDAARAAAAQEFTDTTRTDAARAAASQEYTGATLQGPYQVRTGDTLERIAASKGVTVQDLWNANRDIINNPNQINTRMELKIPPATLGPNPTSPQLYSGFDLARWGRR
jgi:LysM repeat protein